MGKKNSSVISIKSKASNRQFLSAVPWMIPIRWHDVASYIWIYLLLEPLYWKQTISQWCSMNDTHDVGLCVRPLYWQRTILINNPHQCCSMKPMMLSTTNRQWILPTMLSTTNRQSHSVPWMIPMMLSTTSQCCSMNAHDVVLYIWIYPLLEPQSSALVPAKGSQTSTS